MGLGWAGENGGGIEDAPPGGPYARTEGAWVPLPPGTTDTLNLEFSRGNNVNTGAPIGPDSGANNAPGFAVTEAMTLTHWSVSWRDANAGLTGGLNISVRTPSSGAVSTTAVSAAATKDPGSTAQEAHGLVNIPLAVGDLVTITSGINNGGAPIVVSQVTALLQGSKAP